MDAHLRLRSKVSVIGSASDFTYKWSLNVGLSKREAARLALAVNEVVTDVVLYAYVEEEGELEVVFRSDLSTVEVVIRELGEPFDIDRHRYDPQRARDHGDFHGAGFELIRRLVDDFVFLNKGKAGKEFHLVKRITRSEHIADLDDGAHTEVGNMGVPDEYVVADATAADAEDIARLIFRTYGHSYANDDMYFPKKIELALARDTKFGVMVRDGNGEAAGYFAVVRMADSGIGEVAEVVVSPRHRRRGLMTLMLEALVDRARDRKLKGLFGEAVGVHDISQRVNHKLGFHSTALLLAALPATRYKQLVEDYPQDISAVIDFLVLDDIAERKVYLPSKYRDILTYVYGRQGIQVREETADELRPAPRTRLDVDIAYHNQYATVIVRRYGSDFRASIAQTVRSLREQGTRTVFVDLPLENPCVEHGVSVLERLGFVFSGLMLLFHDDRDYLRMQLVPGRLDLNLIATYSPTAREIKRRIQDELQWNTRKKPIG